MTLTSLQILCGDALNELRKLKSDSVHCVVTSPPYYGLRDYSVASQLGLEPTLEEYLARLLAIFAEVKRVLHPSGVCFVDIGDSYNSGTQFNHHSNGLGTDGERYSEGDRKNWCGHRPMNIGLKPKDRFLVPFRLALLLQAAGWWMRDVICWHKPAPMPESVTDRCTQSWEPILMLTKSARYFWDAEAVKEKAIEGTDLGLLRGKADGDTFVSWRAQSIKNRQDVGADSRNGNPSATRNLRNVWSIGPEPFTDSIDGVSHFAAFPSELPKRCILAATSAKGVCPKCGEPWVREVERKDYGTWHNHENDLSEGQSQATDKKLSGDVFAREYVPPKTIAWRVGCDCEAGDPVPATVLDPFLGTGTTCAVALELGRNAIGIELSPAYVKLAKRRCNTVTPGLILA